MILLDTNVISAIMRPELHAPVIAWLDRQPIESIWTTALTVYEIRYGIALLGKGEKRRRLEAAFEVFLAVGLSGRVQPFDTEAAEVAADLAARRQRAGRPAGDRDTLIAGIALARNATIATRNVKHFADLRVPVVDPWTA